MPDVAEPGPSASADDDGPAEVTSEVPDLPTGEPDEALVAEATDEAADTTGPADDGRVGEGLTPDDTEDDPEPEPEPEQPEPEPEQPDPVVAVVESMLPDLAATAREETVATGLADIQRGLDELVRLNRRADEHVAELHSENQRLRTGEIATALAPMQRDLIRLVDEVTRLAEASHPEAQGDLELVRSRLLDTLARWGLSPFVPAVGDPLDATRHQGVGRVPSSDGEPGTIAAVRRAGFAHDDGRIFRAAEVEVFTSPPPPPSDTPTEET